MSKLHHEFQPVTELIKRVKHAMRTDKVGGPMCRVRVYYNGRDTLSAVATDGAQLAEASQSRVLLSDFPEQVVYCTLRETDYDGTFPNITPVLHRPMPHKLWFDRVAMLKTLRKMLKEQEQARDTAIDKLKESCEHLPKMSANERIKGRERLRTLTKRLSLETYPPSSAKLTKHTTVLREKLEGVSARLQIEIKIGQLHDPPSVDLSFDAKNWYLHGEGTTNHSMPYPAEKGYAQFGVRRFRTRYLIDALRNMNTAMVRIRFTPDELSPVCIEQAPTGHPSSTDHFRAIIAGIRRDSEISQVGVLH